jgi:hypothetical protein
MARSFESSMQIGMALVLCVVSFGSAKGQAVPAKENKNSGSAIEHCEVAVAPIQEALRSVCLQLHPDNDADSLRNTIIVGFVGGFVRQGDLKHPEVRFASILRDSYLSNVHVEVFANHQGKEALRRVLRVLDSNRDGVITSDEKEKARIVIYGHSWGGSQTVTLARALGRQGIPVLLTIQIDSVRKPGQEDSIVSANVVDAVNFYQTKGLIHGRATIRAEDPERTRVIGNLQMDYRNRRINCDNYPWLARHFNRPHHEIENDPRVWNQIASLIDSEMLKTSLTVEARIPLLSMH